MGKSLVAESIGIELARRGSDFLNHHVERIEDVVAPAESPNLSLVSGALDPLDAADAETGRQLREQMAAFRPGLVVNQARTPEDAELGHEIAKVWSQHFDIEMDVLGLVEHDDDVWRAARERRPMLLARSEGRAALSLARSASRIQAADAASADARR